MTPELGLGYVSRPPANGEDGHCQSLDNTAHTQVQYIVEQCSRFDHLYSDDYHGIHTYSSNRGSTLRAMSLNMKLVT